jgi:hypothetical protein
MSIKTCPTADGKKVQRIRFYTNIEACGDDYRPVLWPIPHPYWCSGETENEFVLVAYVESMEQLLAQWPEATNAEVLESDLSHYTFGDRFQQPSWFTL